MDNLFDCHTKNAESLSSVSFLQPLLITREGTYEMLKLLGITIDNVNRVIQQNLNLYSPNSTDKKQEHKSLKSYLDEFKFVEKLIHFYLSKENTWVLQKLPIIAFQYLDKLLSEFQMKIFDVLKDYRQN